MASEATTTRTSTQRMLRSGMGAGSFRKARVGYA